MIVFRSAQLDDVGAVARIFASSWRSAYTGLVPQAEIDRRNEAAREGQFRLSLTQPDHGFCLALRDGQPCGVYIIGPSRDEDLSGWGEVKSFYTLEAVWGTGVAQAMMDHALTSLTRQGYSRVFLWVLADNRRARRFYEAAGFSPDGKAQEAYPTVPEVRYVRRLP